ncbi:diaminopimelate epimerase [Candidatus Marinamargulisbacteria bacterium SCGC AG-414-C22]|nr:diaminopimelate epimerase [Candidatus Marinamargulisbacteria bacterium SCGC AG-414-C22]
MIQDLHFAKYHGLGNDFILIDGISQRIDLTKIQQHAIQLCDRNYGVGADGVIIVLESLDCDFRMVIINSDGSEPEMCGNGVRCLAQFVLDKGMINKDVFSLETKAGVMLPGYVKQKGMVKAIEVDMGPPQYDSDLHHAGDVVTKKTVTIADQDYVLHCVSMGNPHAVMFVQSLALIDDALGQAIQPFFSAGINVEFVEIISPHEARIKVWERGVGFTLACGTGACAVLVAGVKTEKLNRKAVIELPGGPLALEWQERDSHVIKTGPACYVFDGHFKF